MARHCPECGFVVGEGANYCPKCGAYLGAEQEAKGDDVTTATYVIDEATGELRPVDVGDVAAESGALVIRSGGGRVGQSFPLRGERMTIGRSPDAAAPAPDDQRPALRRHVADVDRPQLPSLLVDDVGRGRHVLALGLLLGTEVRAALGAVVRPFADDEPALWAVPRHEALGLVAARCPAGEDVGETLHVRSGDHVLTALVLLAQPVHELGAEDVDLAVQDPPAIRHLLLLVRELLDEIFELLIGQRAKVREGVHHWYAVLSSADSGKAKHSETQASVEGRVRSWRTPSRRYWAVEPSTSATPM